MRKSADTDYSRLFASPATSREVQDLSTRGIEVTVPFLVFVPCYVCAHVIFHQ